VNGTAQRMVLKAGGACPGAALAPAVAWGQSLDGDGLQRWIEAVRTIAGRDGNGNGGVRDSARLIVAIGDSRIVLLGSTAFGVSTPTRTRSRQRSPNSPAGVTGAAQGAAMRTWDQSEGGALQRLLSFEEARPPRLPDVRDS
jgi:hypothetical protein